MKTLVRREFPGDTGRGLDEFKAAILEHDPVSPILVCRAYKREFYHRQGEQRVVSREQLSRVDGADLLRGVDLVYCDEPLKVNDRSACERRLINWVARS